MQRQHNPPFLDQRKKIKKASGLHVGRLITDENELLIMKSNITPTHSRYLLNKQRRINLNVNIIVAPCIFCRITSVYQPTNAHIISHKTLLKHFKTVLCKIMCANKDVFSYLQRNNATTLRQIYTSVQLKIE